MKKITKEILKKLNNEHTKIEEKEDFKGNYYSYLNDTIYIAKNFTNQKQPKSTKDMNPKAAELIMICHECIHSIQNKLLHLLNTIFSNISIVLSIVAIVFGLFGNNKMWLDVIACFCLLLSIIVRVILELHAINKSIEIAISAINKKIINGVFNKDIEEATRYINKHKYLAVLQMVSDKIIFLILLLIIK